jgi:hypothetical protein
VPQGVGGAVEAGCLAVPDADHAVAGRLADDRCQLGALHGVGAELLVDVGPEHHAVLVEQRGLPLQFEVIAGQRRALVAGDQRPGVPVVLEVEPVLLDRDAHQGLQAGQVDDALVALVPVAQ